MSHAPACKFFFGVETLRNRVGHTHTHLLSLKKLLFRLFRGSFRQRHAAFQTQAGKHWCCLFVFAIYVLVEKFASHIDKHLQVCQYLLHLSGDSEHHTSHLTRCHMAAVSFVSHAQHLTLQCLCSSSLVLSSNSQLRISFGLQDPRHIG